MRSILLGLVLFCAHAPFLAVLASAQEPLALTVRPSRWNDIAEEAKARQERLERRMRQNEFAFRSICIHCGPGDRFPTTVPFQPLQVLGAGQARRAPPEADRDPPASLE